MGWRDRVLHRLLQEPLVDTAESLRALRRAPLGPRPAAIFAGIGLCTPERLSQALPLDVLGMLIPAELIRRACDAAEVVAVIADRHAAVSGFDDAEVERRAAAVERILVALSQHPGFCLRVIRASSFHDLGAYRRLRAEVEARLENPAPYLARQLADTAFLDREYGHIWKLGWSMGRGRGRRTDEVGFDSMFRACYGDRLGFLYCKPGRSLDDARPRKPPYVAPSPDNRVCLSRAEDPSSKLDRTGRPCSLDTLNGVRRHLGRILYTYNRHLGPLPRGSLESRVTWLIERLLPPGCGAGAGIGAGAGGGGTRSGQPSRSW